MLYEVITEVQALADVVVGANKLDAHYTGTNHGRDFQVDAFAVV